MEKVIYQDENGLYFVDYDASGNPIKVYCDENGNALQADEENSTLEIFQQEDGTYYYVAYNELGEAYKVPCDENGNDIVVNKTQSAPYVAPAAPTQNTQETNNRQVPPVAGAGMAAGAGFAGAAAAAAGTATYQGQNKNFTGIKGVVLGVLVAIALLFGGYFAYSTFIAKPVANMAGYGIHVDFTGKDGEGKAVAKITSIPDVKASDSTKQAIIDELLTNANITYSKDSGLKNGDSVSVNVDVDPQEAEAAGLELEGTFKKTVTVEGLEAKSSSSSESKSGSSDDKKSEEKKLEYKQVYNTGYKGLLMRTGPSQSYPAITTLFDGTPVKVLGYDGSWAKVDYNGTQGWMYTGYLR